MAWQFNSSEAVFIQIAKRLRGEILSGKYRPGEQVPPVRQLAAMTAVNPNTVQRSLAYLEEQGLLYTCGTVGRFITEDTAVLDAARERMRKEAVRSWLAEARTLGISTAELLRYIKEEDDDL